MTSEQEMQALWAAAEARRDAGQSPLRVIRPAYSLPPGDGEISARPWLTEAEADRVHELWLDIQNAETDRAADPPAPVFDSIRRSAERMMRPAVVMASTRDATWRANPDTRTPKKYHISDGGLAACSGVPLAEDPAIPAQRVRLESRCQRPGCRKLWPA